MIPQATAEQFQYIINNLRKRIDAKTLEIDSLERLRSNVPALMVVYKAVALQALGTGIGSAAGKTLQELQTAEVAAQDWLTSQIQVAEVDLEELEVNHNGLVAQLKQKQSGIVIPNVGRRN